MTFIKTVKERAQYGVFGWTLSMDNINNKLIIITFFNFENKY